MSEVKNIKDYLHLYLGCDVELDNSGSKVIKKLIAVGGVDDGEYQYCKLRLGSPEKGHVHSLFLKEHRIKLFLRPLSDMTEEEGKQYVSLGFGGLPVMKDKQRIIYTTFTPPCLNWLRKMGFDCDELIESGLAIDKTKQLTPNL